MEAEIRQYRDNDKAALMTCMEGLEDYIASLDDLQRCRPLADYDSEVYIHRLLQKVSEQDGAIYLADDGGKIVGVVARIIPEITEDDMLEGYPSKDGKILELYIHSAYRGQKVGLGLMQAMEKYFRNKGVALAAMLIVLLRMSMRTASISSAGTPTDLFLC